MMAAAAGLAVGAAETVPVLLAGGTQMAAVLALIKGMDYSALGNIAIGTTRWIAKDTTSDLRSLVSQIGKVPVLAANLNFSLSRYDGLKIYETGLVKEGGGAHRSQQWPRVRASSPPGPCWTRSRRATPAWFPGGRRNDLGIPAD
jgi:NaMN:DMB phosphoribosyltransferase